MNKVHLADCMDVMRMMPDKSVDLCIVDPPYFKEYGKANYVGSDISTSGVRRHKFESKNWGIPDKEYFNELFRISRNQIIWGANYFSDARLFGGAIIWDKKNDKSTFSQCDFAFCSMQTKISIFRFMWNGMLQENMSDKEVRIHPTQKPVALYKWLLKNYAKPNDKIFDSHVGSGSLRIACYDMGFDFEGCEIDKDYWEAQEKRYQQHIMQGDLFSSEDTQKAIYQGVMF